MDSEHTGQLIADYVLGLLPVEQSRHVERHARQCLRCREAIQRERQLAFHVRSAVQLAARPPAGRLEALRPPLPRSAARRRGTLYRQLAPVMALAMLLVVVLLAQVGGRGLPTPGFGRADRTPTSTATHTPTATLAAAGGPTAVATAVPATLTRVGWPGAPAPAEPATSGHVPPVEPAVAATPIITLVR